MLQLSERKGQGKGKKKGKKKGKELKASWNKSIPQDKWSLC